MPIRWTIDEELPIGSLVGSVKEVLSMINTDFKQMNSIHVKLVQSNDTAWFLLDSRTGLLCVISAIRHS
jgi:hypothetical protein